MVLFGCALLFMLNSCDDQQFDTLMNRYCTCISAARNQPNKQDDCRMIMDTIKKKYRGNSEKMGEIVKRAGKCY